MIPRHGLPEQDLTNCGRALAENLITKKGIAAKDIVLFGNCLGSSIAEYLSRL